MDELPRPASGQANAGRFHVDAIPESEEFGATAMADSSPSGKKRDASPRYQRPIARRLSDPSVLLESQGGEMTPASARKKRFGKHLTEQYEVLEQLGSGSFSTVFKCRLRPKTNRREVSQVDPDKVFALKQIDTRRGSENTPREVAHEIAMMKLAGKHDNIIHCFATFLEGPYVNIIVDMFSGGDLIDGLNNHFKVHGRGVADAPLANLIRQMVAAIAHVHHLSIVHRDVKGENFLSNITDISDPKCHVALADFGSAARLEPAEKLSPRVGTAAFWAPEVVKGSYSFRVDVWALGVTAFVLLAGQLPFEGEEKICRVGGPAYSFPDRTSPLCIDFIRACLTPEPELRITAEEAARNIWLRPSSTSINRTEQDVKKFIEGLCGGVLQLLAGLFGCCYEALAVGADALLNPPKHDVEAQESPPSSTLPRAVS